MKSKTSGRGRHTHFTVFASILFLVACGLWPGGAQAQRRPIAILFVAGPYVTVNGAPAATGMTIHGGDHVATGPESSANVNFFAGGSVQLDANTDPWFQEVVWEGYKCLIHVILGYGQIYAVGSTPCASHGSNVISALSEFNFRVGAGGDTLTVTEGQVLAGGAQWTTVTAGTQVTLSGGTVVAQRQVSAEEIRRITGWRGRYRFTPAAAPPPPPLPMPRPLPPPPSNWVTPPPLPTTCPPGWIYNPLRRNCVPVDTRPPPDRCPAGSRYDGDRGGCVPGDTRPPRDSCPAGLRYDPRRGACVRAPADGIRRPPQSCPADQYYDPRTRTCLPEIR
jgi:hypothetical protein